MDFNDEFRLCLTILCKFFKKKTKTAKVFIVELLRSIRLSKLQLFFIHSVYNN